jgi:hypothetical protein
MIPAFERTKTVHALEAWPLLWALLRTASSKIKDSKYYTKHLDYYIAEIEIEPGFLGRLAHSIIGILTDLFPLPNSSVKVKLSLS